MISYELLPCPFCGAEAKPVFSGSCNYVTCSKEDGCWCSLTCPTRTPEEAVRIWNRRTIDRPTCEDTGDGWTFHCSACGCELDLEDREGEPTMWLGESAMTPRHCPNCGAVVTDTLDASKVDGK